MDDSRRWKSCIANKGYPDLRKKGYIGVSSGNPVNQNVNDIDVQVIDFFNRNEEFYQHDANNTVDK